VDANASLSLRFITIFRTRSDQSLLTSLASKPEHRRHGTTTENHVRISRFAIYTLIVIAAAVALHAYEQTAKSADPSPIFFLWSMFPYSVVLLILLSCDSALPAAFGATAAFALDCMMYHDVFIAPKSSTAALGLLAMPLWSAFVVLPIVIFIVWLIVRIATRKSRAEERQIANGGG
jgi:hypothetical protein